jgi:biopolymer transport protein TolR
VNQITEQRTVITIDRNQNVFLSNANGESPVNLANLGDALKAAASAPADKRVVYLRADEKVPFGAFASVMDAVKQAGITNISIVTQPLDPNQK